MDGVLTDESKVKLCTNRLANPPMTTLKMLLSNSNITPDHATVAADLTVNEISVTGYSRQDVTGWGTPTLDGSNRAVATATPVTFLNTSGGDSPTVYTWGFIDTATNKLVAAGRFDLPFILPATTGSYTTTPFWRDTGA